MFTQIKNEVSFFSLSKLNALRRECKALSCQCFQFNSVMELFENVRQSVCLLPWLQHVVFVWQLVSYLATLGVEMGNGIIQNEANTSHLTRNGHFTEHTGIALLFGEASISI